MTAAPMIHVLGANGRCGSALCAALLAQDYRIAQIVRSPPAISPCSDAARVADLTGDLATLWSVLADARIIINTAHARHIPAILRAAPPHATLIALGSTRKFTRWIDAHATGVLEGEHALLSSGRPGLILHPTMIYGASGEDNVQRLAHVARRLPFWPLPKGGRAKVQPIYQNDVTRCLVAAIRLAIEGRLDTPRSMVIAGPNAMSYRDFLSDIAIAAGFRSRSVISIPSLATIFAARVIDCFPLRPRIRSEEVRRLLEDKAFDIAEMRQTLGIEPIKFQDGLALLFNPFAKKER